MALTADQYISRKVFALENETLLRAQWLFVGLRHDLPVCGDMMETSVFGESVIVVNTGQDIRAFANVCPHRGSRLLDCGIKRRSGRLVCPYHHWVFKLNGSLERFGGGNQRQVGQTAASSGLTELSVFEFQELIFVSLDGDPDEVKDACQRVMWWAALFAEKGISVAARTSKTAAVNWKLWVENFLECYHCELNHPQLRRMEAFINAAADGKFEQYQSQVQQEISRLSLWHDLHPVEFDETHTIPSYLSFETLNVGFQSETMNGQLAAPAVLPADFAGNFLYGCLGPFVHFTVCADHFTLFSFCPNGVDQVNIETRWITGRTPSAIDAENLTRLWCQTLDEDITLVERVQHNFSSSFHRPAHYVASEVNSENFVNWYEKSMKSAACF